MTARVTEPSEPSTSSAEPSNIRDDNLDICSINFALISLNL